MHEERKLDAVDEHDAVAELGAQALGEHEHEGAEEFEADEVHGECEHV